MSGPERLSQSSGDLGLLLRAARRAKAPVRSRNQSLAAAAAVLTASGSAAGAAAAGEGAAVGAAKAGTLLGAKWVAIVGLASAGAAMGTVALVPRRAVVASQPPGSDPASAGPASWAVHPSSSSTGSSAPTSPAATPPSATAALSVASTAASPRPARGAPIPPVATPASSATPGAGALSEELALLDQARSPLARGDAPRALAILDQYAARFPSGSMAPEATMLRIEALLKAGDRAAATRFADALLASDPGGPYGPRIQSLFGGTNP